MRGELLKHFGVIVEELLLNSSMSVSGIEIQGEQSTGEQMLGVCVGGMSARVC